jgi:hypothetical protein
MLSFSIPAELYHWSDVLGRVMIHAVFLVYTPHNSQGQILPLDTRDVANTTYKEGGRNP